MVSSLDAKPCSPAGKMIRYNLKCTRAHEFDSWFQSAAAFDSLSKAGMIECPVCGDHGIEKLLMAPAIRPGRKIPPADTTSAADTAPPPRLSQPASETEAALTNLRAGLEANSEYVGEGFADEARKMHSGDAPERAIHGETQISEAKKLLEEGVPILPLPFLPKRRTN